MNSDCAGQTPGLLGMTVLCWRRVLKMRWVVTPVSIPSDGLLAKANAQQAFPIEYLHGGWCGNPRNDRVDV